MRLPPVTGKFLVSLCLLGYSGGHFFGGDRGLIAMLALQTDLSVTKTRLAELKTAQTDLTDQVKRLRRSNIDVDMADEQARLLLSYAEPDEMVILFDADGQLPTTGVQQASLR